MYNDFILGNLDMSLSTDKTSDCGMANGDVDEFSLDNGINNHSEISSMFYRNGVQEKIEVSLDDINKLNITINDNDCSNYFMRAVCDKLEQFGIKYAYSSHEDNISNDSHVVITLDQQYVSGPKLCVIAPYDNISFANSDALAVSLDVAFRSAGISTNGVVCGKRGFRIENKGTSSMRVPTPTEDAVRKMLDSETSFVTIAFGTGLPSDDVVARVIKDGLARYVSYISNKNNSDLIYRVEVKDDLETLSRRFGCTSSEISKLNNLGDNVLIDDAIINPTGYGATAFNESIDVCVLGETIKREI